MRIEAREAAHQLAWGDPLLRWAPYRWMAEPGTIHLSDATLLPPVVSNLYGVVSLDGAAAWAPDSLTVDGARLMFAPGFDLSVTNGVTVRGGGTLEMIHPAGFSCGGDLLLDNGRLAMKWKSNRADAWIAAPARCSTQRPARRICSGLAGRTVPWTAPG